MNSKNTEKMEEYWFKTTGFEPAYVLHFTQWVKEQQEAQEFYVC